MTTDQDIVNGVCKAIFLSKTAHLFLIDRKLVIEPLVLYRTADNVLELIAYVDSDSDSGLLTDTIHVFSLKLVVQLHYGSDKFDTDRHKSNVPSIPDSAFLLCHAYQP